MKAQGISVLNEPLIASPGDTSIDIYIQTPPADKPATSLTITDLTTSTNDRFTQTGSPAQVAKTPKSVIWKTVWTLGKGPTFNKTRHVFLAQWGDLSGILTINITKEDEGQVRFSLSSANFRTRYQKSVSIQAIANYAVTNPEVETSSLTDARTGITLDASNFQISSSPNPPKPDSASHQVVSNLSLTLKQGGIAPGKYDGALVLGTSGRANLGSIQLTIYSTSLCHQLLGVLCLFLGLLCFFLFSVVIKGYNRWLMALLPAARLLKTVNSLRKQTESASTTTGYQFSHLLSDQGAPGSLLQLQQDLSKNNLKDLGFLPLIIVNPFVQSDLSSEYRAFLILRSNQIESLKLIVTWGIASVVHSWNDLKRLRMPDRGTKALDDLDRLAVNAGGPLLMLTNQIQANLDSLQQDIAKAYHDAAFGGAPAGAPASPMLSAQQITIQLEQLSIAGWVLWAFVTLLVGSCALVWFNDGFGIGRDYLQCFLWGIGIPSVAQGFGGLNANSVTSAFSLQIPK